jgi:cardiolipin synthase A/B
MKKKQLFTLLTFFVASSFANAQSLTTYGNSIEPLITGEDLNARRLEVIRNAKHFIYLKTFIINRDPSEAEVYKALCEKAQEGIDVRMLVDELGRFQGGNPIKMRRGEFSVKWFKSCGIRLERYAKASWGPIDFILYSQHDKLLVTENAGIMGGTNFSQDYSAHSQLSKQWYDYDIAVQGPAVCSLQQIFNMSWWMAYKQELIGIKKLSGKSRRYKLNEKFSPKTLDETCYRPEAVGSNEVTMIYNDPKFSKKRPFVDYFNDSIDRVIESNDKRSIDLYAPYFVPNRKILAKLVEAAEADVRVRIITNSVTSIDPQAFPAYVAMLMRIRPLLRSGVKIYLWNPSNFENSGLEKDNVFHKKGGCFGNINCFVGSHNLDVRGDKFSSELIAVLTSEDIMNEQKKRFEEDMEFVIPLTLESARSLLKNSKITNKIIARIAGWAM